MYPPARIKPKIVQEDKTFLPEAKQRLYTKVRVGFKMCAPERIYKLFIQVLFCAMQIKSTDDVEKYFVGDVAHHVTRSAALSQKIEDITAEQFESVLMYLVICSVFSISPPVRMAHVMQCMKQTEFVIYLQSHFYRFQHVQNHSSVSSEILFQQVEKLQSTVCQWLKKKNLMAETLEEFIAATNPTKPWYYSVLIAMKFFVCEVGQQVLVVLMGMIRLSMHSKYCMLKVLTKFCGSCEWFQLQECFRQRKKAMKHFENRKPFIPWKRQLAHATVALFLYVTFMSFYNMPDTKMQVVEFCILESASEGIKHVWKDAKPIIDENFRAVAKFFKKQREAREMVVKERASKKHGGNKVKVSPDDTSKAPEVKISPNDTWKAPEVKISPDDKSKANRSNSSFFSWFTGWKFFNNTVLESAPERHSSVGNISVFKNATETNVKSIGENVTAINNLSNVTSDGEIVTEINAGSRWYLWREEWESIKKNVGMVSKTENVGLIPKTEQVSGKELIESKNNATWLANTCNVNNDDLYKYLHNKRKLAPFYIDRYCISRPEQCDKIDLHYVYHFQDESFTCVRMFVYLEGKKIRKSCHSYLKEKNCWKYLELKQVFNFMHDPFLRKYIYHAHRKIVVTKNVSKQFLN